MVNKIIENGIKIAVNAAFTVMLSATAYTFIDGQKRSNEASRLAVKREKVGLPGYNTVEEEKRKNK